MITIIGWMGEKAMLTMRCYKTSTVSKENFYRFHTLTVPLSPPVAKRQYLAEAAAQVSYSWDSRISLMILNSLSEFL